jgi:hypothetical protein
MGFAAPQTFRELPIPGRDFHEVCRPGVGSLAADDTAVHLDNLKIQTMRRQFRTRAFS